MFAELPMVAFVFKDKIAELNSPREYTPTDSNLQIHPIKVSRPKTLKLCCIPTPDRCAIGSKACGDGTVTRKHSLCSVKLIGELERGVLQTIPVKLRAGYRQRLWPT
jgi:hypothetical protein